MAAQYVSITQSLTCSWCAYEEADGGLGVGEVKDVKGGVGGLGHLLEIEIDF